MRTAVRPHLDIVHLPACYGSADGYSGVIQVCLASYRGTRTVIQSYIQVIQRAESNVDILRCGGSGKLEPLLPAYRSDVAASPGIGGG